VKKETLLNSEDLIKTIVQECPSLEERWRRSAETNISQEDRLTIAVQHSGKILIATSACAEEARSIAQRVDKLTKGLQIPLSQKREEVSFSLRQEVIALVGEALVKIKSLRNLPSDVKRLVKNSENTINSILGGSPPPSLTSREEICKTHRIRSIAYHDSPFHKPTPEYSLG
jgi:hypothetical protein